MVKPVRNRRGRPVVIALVVLGLVIAAYKISQWYKTRDVYEWSGTIEARFINVGSRTGGRIKEVLVREGDRVQAGTTLIVLEAGDLEAQRLQAQGQLEEAQAALERLEAGARPEEITQARARAAQAQAAFVQTRRGPRSEEIAAARARLQAAQARVDKAAADVERARSLAQAQAISQTDLDTVETTMRSAAAERDAQLNALNELVRGSRPEETQQAQARAREAQAAARLVESGSRIEDIHASQARVTSARGRLDQIMSDLNELTIRAPRASRVEALDLRPGDILAPNATAARLLEPDQLFVRVYVPETQLGYIRPELEVSVSVDSFPDRTFKGIVEYVSHEGEFTPRNFQTMDERANQVFASHVRIEAGKEVLRAGMAAIVQVRVRP